MTRGLTDMIKDLFAALRAAGVEIDDGLAMNVEIQLRRQYGGERVYIQSLPKLRRAAQITFAQAHLGTAARSIQRLSKATGIPARTVKRIVNGK
jgi:Mor family transcriptional regulator